MIILHKISGEEFMLNSDHIETVEERPDTVITLSNDRKYLVMEKIEEITLKVVEFRRKIRLSCE